MTDTVKTHGGRRPGAGRPPLPSRQIRVSAALLDKVQQMAKKEGLTPRAWIEKKLEDAV